ncbi:MAG: hypothetical protein Q8911_01560, partial [Bacillota bacterium]|nr:hypothetical protein [Bacillota bacterium]
MSKRKKDLRPFWSKLFSAGKRSIKPEPDQPCEAEFKQTPNSHCISVPSGKLVSLKGFNQYFSSPEWVELKDADNNIAEEMREVGQDFPTYFGAGESIFPRAQRKMGILNGLKNYIAEVDHEERLEKVNTLSDSTAHCEMPKPIEKPLFSPIFDSQKDQEDFLAQFKDKKIPQDLEVSQFSEKFEAIVQVEEIAPLIES